MSGTVRNQRQYILIQENGNVLKDFTIFVDDESHVTVYTDDGDCFDGDLLALEALAGLHRAVAYPVMPPPDFNGEIQEEILQDEKTLEIEVPVTDWAETVSNESSEAGVILPQAISLPEDDSNGKGKSRETPVREEHGESSKDPVPGAGATSADAIGFFDPSASAQGIGTYAGVVVLENRHLDRKITSLVVPYKPFTLMVGRDYGVAPRKRGAPVNPMFTKRDLGNCVMGMPVSAGTTIVGALRPDTGGKNPAVPDHEMWLQHAIHLGLV